MTESSDRVAAPPDSVTELVMPGRLGVKVATTVLKRGEPEG